MHNPSPTQRGLARLASLQERNELRQERQAAKAPRFARLADAETQQVVLTGHNLFPTPPDLAARMAALANIAPGHRILEPSAGTGRLLAAIQAQAPEAHLTACEVEPSICAHLFAAFPSVTLWQGDFLEREPASLFDRVIMNPPFHRGEDIRHIRHALQFLAPGGVLVALCYAGAKQEPALRHLCDHWETIPGAFAHEGTRASVHLLRIAKATGERHEANQTG